MTQLHLSYKLCEDITRRSRSSFRFAFRILPAHQRRAMHALYAFMRICDDIADEPGEPEKKQKALTEWRSKFEAMITGEYCDPIYPALHDAIKQFEIPPDYFREAITGVQADLDTVRFTDFDELKQYCFRVASVVGLACVHIWGWKSGVAFAEIEPLAVDAGIAFQLTNILRDLGDDLAQNRIYLPQQELEQFSANLKQWQAEPYRKLMRFQVARAREYYQSARRLPELLQPRGAAIYRLMASAYEQLLNQIEATKYDVFTRRIRLTRWQKLRLVRAMWWAKWSV